MMSTSTVRRSNKFPFTATQWQELEHQALIYKYMVAGIPIPPDLLFSINNRSLDSSSSSKLFPTYQTSPIGWNPYQMEIGYGGKKMDPEPGRCRRTDGKKWRCSKEAYPDSKYCDRHMHRGKNRSRKPVEVVTLATPTPANQQQITKLPPNASSSSSSSSSFHSSSFQSPCDTSFHYGNYHLYPGHSSGVKEGVGAGEHAFFTDTSGASRGSSSMDHQQHTTKQEEKLQMHIWGRDLGTSEAAAAASSMEVHLNRDPITTSNDPRKTIHHFFDDSSTTQLSISMPTSSQDFFLSRSCSAPHNHNDG